MLRLHVLAVNRLSRAALQLMRPARCSLGHIGGPTAGTKSADPLGCIVFVLVHLPETGHVTTRYEGWSANRSRGMRAKAEPAAAVSRAARSPETRPTLIEFPVPTPVYSEAQPGVCRARTDMHRLFGCRPNWLKFRCGIADLPSIPVISQGFLTDRQYLRQVR